MGWDQAYTGILAGEPPAGRLCQAQREECERVAKEVYRQACEIEDRIVQVLYESDAELRCVKAHIVGLGVIALSENSPGYAPNPNWRPSLSTSNIDLEKSTDEDIWLKNGSVIRLRWKRWKD